MIILSVSCGHNGTLRKEDYKLLEKKLVKLQLTCTQSEPVQKFSNIEEDSEENI